MRRDIAAAARMRLFLALNIEPAVRRRCYAAAEPLRAARPDVRWVDENKLHLTLKFLGDQPDTLVTPLSAALDMAAAQSRRPMDLALGAVGAFPNFRQARVVWLGVTPDPKLELLHHDVEVACHALDLEVDGKPFRPHVTLGREQVRADADARRTLREAARAVKVRATSAVSSVDLMESAGGRYRLLHAAPLGA
jgi:RNA 2',3'-cyclic 3'-phosphodiesterase